MKQKKKPYSVEAFVIRVISLALLIIVGVKLVLAEIKTLPF